MNTINLFKADEFDVQILFPTSWDELQPAEIFAIAKQILNPTATSAETKSALLLLFIENRAKEQKIKLPKRWQQKINIEDFVIQGLPLLNFIYDENNLKTPPEKTIHLQGVHKYTVVAPEDGFVNISCGEFEDAEREYKKFVLEPKPEYLANIAAIFYRPKGVHYQTKDKDGRLITYPYHKWASMFLKLEDYRLYAIFIWFVGSKNQFPKMFPVLHEPADGDDATSSENDLMVFTRCIHSGAGTKNGDRNQIRLTKVLEFMFEMEQQATTAKKQKELYEQQS